MRALVCREWGDPTKSRAEGGVLGVEDVPPPGRVPPRGLRVTIICASLNFADCLLVRNLYQEKPALPFTPGGEFCGAVLELGAELQKDGPFRVGQVVAGAVVGGGAMAEELVVPDASASAFIPAPGPALATAPAAVPTADAAAQMRQEISDLMVATAVAQPMAVRAASPKSSGGKELVVKTPRWVLTEEAKA